MPPTPDPRRLAAADWLTQFAEIDAKSLAPASADASFRRYFRVATANGSSCILMDAPPEREPLDAFLQVADLFEKAGLRVPRRLGVSKPLGFLLLEDFGSDPYLPHLQPDTARALYQSAWQALVRLQAWGLAQPADSLGLPAYSREKLMEEMGLFERWYVQTHLGQTLSSDEAQMLGQTMGRLADRALAQPQVIVHRDFHSRNLMVLPETLAADGQPGILDFQDAVVGPLSYDLVSLLRDAYVVWEEAQQMDWAIRYWEDARRASIPVPPDFAEFWEDFEWMGLQRQLKVLGIFARLAHRDGKQQYLQDIPAVVSYASKTAHRYQALSGLARLLDRLGHVSPTAQFTF
jgi:aminoglycoside/choline kinase family phosphotransferase